MLQAARCSINQLARALKVLLQKNKCLLPLHLKRKSKKISLNTLFDSQNIPKGIVTVQVVAQSQTLKISGR